MKTYECIARSGNTGKQIVLSSILGHAQASTTFNFYAHDMPDHKKQSMEKMAVYYEKSLASE